MRKSSGILLYRLKNNHPEFFLIHPGGPFWKNKDVGAWSIPKGEFDDTEEALAAAVREFKEETGYDLHGTFEELTPVKQKGGKLVYAFIVEGDLDASAINSNTFKMEWPYKSGKWITVPEVDKADWFTIDEAKSKINSAQVAFLDEWTSIYSSKNNFRNH